MQHLICGLILCLMLAGPAAAQQPVDVELVLAADGSGSIDGQEFELQRAGYADAIRSPQVLAAIRNGLLGRIAVALIEWGDPESQHVIVDWHVISDAASADAFAARLLDMPRKAWGYNSISNALAFSAAMIRDNAYEGTRRIIDLSGDGPQIGGAPLEQVRAAILAEGITINALAIRSPGGTVAGPRGEPIDLHYRNRVIGGQGAFVAVAEGRADFARAIRSKLVLEIAGMSAQEQHAER